MMKCDICKEEIAWYNGNLRDCSECKGDCFIRLCEECETKEE